MGVHAFPAVTKAMDSGDCRLAWRQHECIPPVYSRFTHALPQAPRYGVRHNTNFVRSIQFYARCIVTTIVRKQNSNVAEHLNNSSAAVSLAQAALMLVFVSAGLLGARHTIVQPNAHQPRAHLRHGVGITRIIQIYVHTHDLHRFVRQSRAQSCRRAHLWRFPASAATSGLRQIWVVIGSQCEQSSHLGPNGNNCNPRIATLHAAHCAPTPSAHCTLRTGHVVHCTLGIPHLHLALCTVQTAYSAYCTLTHPERAIPLCRWISSNPKR